MDFNLLSEDALQQFLQVAADQLPDLPSLTASNNALLAAKVFVLLNNFPGQVQYTDAVLDLYYSRKNNNNRALNLVAGYLPGGSSASRTLSGLASSAVGNLDQGVIPYSEINPLVRDLDHNISQLPIRTLSEQTQRTLIQEVEQNGSTALLNKYVAENDYKWSRLLLEAGAKPSEETKVLAKHVSMKNLLKKYL